MSMTLPACAEKDDFATGSETDPTAPGGTDSDATSDDPTVAETADDPIATDPEPDDTSATDDGTGEDTEDTAGEETVGEETGFVPPEACGMPDPTVKATFTLELAGWPIEPDDFDILAPCKIDAVTTADGTVSTALTCEFEGEPRVAALDILAPPEGEVTWAAGEDVLLTAEMFIDPFDHGDLRSVALRAGDESLLVSAVDSRVDELYPQRFLPLVAELVRVCTEDPFSDYVPAQLDLAAPGGPAVSIISGQRGVLPIAGDQRFVIDVEEATVSSLHGPEEMRVLLRRVQGGG